MSKRKPHEFTVRLVIPEGATVRDAKFYIDEALRAWRGQLRPPGGCGAGDLGDPMWALDVQTLVVVGKRRIP